jgi:hypothetical protein
VFVVASSSSVVVGASSSSSSSALQFNTEFTVQISVHTSNLNIAVTLAKLCAALLLIVCAFVLSFIRAIMHTLVFIITWPRMSVTVCALVLLV